MNSTVDGFKGHYAFLSNKAPCKITIGGKVYPSVANAFEASKTLNSDERAQFEKCSPASAAKLGKKITTRSNWENVQVEIMRELLIQKFYQEPYKTLLKDTGNVVIIEENNWISPIITEIRTKLRQEKNNA